MCELLDPRAAFGYPLGPDSTHFRIRSAREWIPAWRWYDRREVILLSFLAGLFLVVAASGYVAVQGVGLWRQTKRTGGAFTGELARFDERAARTERLLAEFDRSSQELVAAQERLRISRARLQVLTGSLEAAQRKTAWLRAFVPSR